MRVVPGPDTDLSPFPVSAWPGHKFSYPYDRATGKYFAYARLYDTETDRMLGKDPVNYIDPTGEISDYDSSVIINKRDVSLRDLAALIAKTGDEFAMFTRGSQRMIIRGNTNGVNINKDIAQELYNAGFKWSGHTHPGNGTNVLFSSSGDRYILEQFKQAQSVILDRRGNYNIFEIGE